MSDANKDAIRDAIIKETLIEPTKDVISKIKGSSESPEKEATEGRQPIPKQNKRPDLAMIEKVIQKEKDAGAEQEKDAIEAEKLKEKIVESTDKSLVNDLMKKFF